MAYTAVPWLVEELRYAQKCSDVHVHALFVPSKRLDGQ
jgi:hypothetical protein